MARTKKTFHSLSPCDQVSIASLVKAVPVSAIGEAMAECSRKTIRRRKLSVELLIYYVIFLSFFAGHSTAEVLKYVLNGLSRIFPGCFRGTACESAISQGRTRLGDEVMRLLFKIVCRPLADAGRPKSWSFHKGLRLVAIDGSDLDLPDEKAIRKEYPIANDGGKNRHPCPKLRFNALVEVGSRCMFDAEMADTRGDDGKPKTLGAKDDSEAALTDALLERLPSGALLLGDRFHPSCRNMLAVVGRGSHFLFRAKDSMALLPDGELADGSCLATVRRRKEAHGERMEVTVRVINYCICDKDRKVVGEGRLVTSLMDEAAFPAQELAALYHERWEAELLYDEIKTHVLGGALKGLRSKTPALARQEFWGLLIAHYVVRKAIFEAAESSGRDPDDISFTGTVEIIRRHTGAAVFPPHEKLRGNLGQHRRRDGAPEGQVEQGEAQRTGRQEGNALPQEAP